MALSSDQHLVRLVTMAVGVGESIVYFIWSEEMDLGIDFCYLLLQGNTAPQTLELSLM